MSEEYRRFDELPEPVWRSDGGQLIKAISELINHNGPLSLLCVLATWDQELVQESPRLRQELEVVIRHSKGMTESLSKVLSTGNAATLRDTLADLSLQNDHWMQQQVAKIEATDKSRTWLKSIEPQLKEFLTWDVAVHYVHSIAKPADDMRTMDVSMIGEAIPYAMSQIHGDKIIFGKTVGSWLSKSKTIIKNIKTAVDTMPEDVLANFLQRQAFRNFPPIPLKEGLQTLETNPLLLRIEQFVQRAKSAGLG